jgi:hypothetical protein
VCGLLMETNQECMDRLYLRMDTGQPAMEKTTAADAA